VVKDAVSCDAQLIVTVAEPRRIVTLPHRLAAARGALIGYDARPTVGAITLASHTSSGFARASSAARIVAATNSTRLSRRTAASTAWRERAGLLLPTS
jgi:hypothetical protein